MSDTLFYTKDVIDGKMVKVPLYDTEFYTNCDTCGDEISIDHLDFGMLILSNDGLLGTTVACEKCEKEGEASL